jgi:hypothetical protein
MATFTDYGLPALRQASGQGQSVVDPNILPYLQMGLQQAEKLFFQQQPSMYPGQTYVSPSQQTLSALQQQEQLAAGAQPALQQAQQAYQQSLGTLGQTTSGAFLQGSPYQQQMMAAATRPLTQQFEQQVLPGISSLYSRAGRYGSGSMERALGTATEGYGRALGDITAGIAYRDYEAERNRQLEAAKVQAALAEAAPSFYSQQFLPSQTLAQVGAAREQIASQPLQEAMQRYSFQQQLPYLQLQSYLSGVYGNPLAQYQALQPQQTNQFAQAVGGALTGAAIGGTPGAVLGGLLGLKL